VYEKQLYEKILCEETRLRLQAVDEVDTADKEEAYVLEGRFPCGRIPTPTSTPQIFLKKMCNQRHHRRSSEQQFIPPQIDLEPIDIGKRETEVLEENFEELVISPSDVTQNHLPTIGSIWRIPSQPDYVAFILSISVEGLYTVQWLRYNEKNQQFQKLRMKYVMAFESTDEWEYICEEEIVGKKVEIFWDGEKKWFRGTIRKKMRDEYIVKYLDGEVCSEKLDRDSSEWKLIGF